MNEINAYVINLKERPDRWKSVEMQRSLLKVPIIRVEAVDQNFLSEKEVRFAAKGVAATWLSHKKAAEKFLETNLNYALILEDDFHLSQNFEIPSLKILLGIDADFVQLGYLRVTPWESLDLNVANLRDLVLRLIKRLVSSNSIARSRYQNRLLIREREGVPIAFVPSDIRPGGHCYIVSRRMALAMQRLNDPIIFSADELFVSISKMRSFKMFRLRASKVSQTNSPTSVDVRFKNF